MIGTSYYRNESRYYNPWFMYISMYSLEDIDSTMI